MEQRTDDWLAWRNKGIGSSDAPIIMGVSPWCTPYELWEYKTEKKQRDQTSNWAQERGNRLEPIARAKYELLCDIEMGAALCQHNEYEFLRASMDGWNPTLKKGVEFKAPGIKDHEEARAGRVPEKYFPQVQHQLLVTGADSIDYASYYVEKGADESHGELVIVNVKPNLEWLTQYLHTALEFWKCVTDDVAPKLSDRDFKVLKGKKIVDLAESYKAAKEAADAAQAKLEEIELALKQEAEELPRVMFADTGLTVTTVYRQGSVNYKSIPELKNVDLNKYRGKPTTYKKIHLAKLK